MNRLTSILWILALFPFISPAYAASTNGQIYVIKGTVFVTQGKKTAQQVINNEAITANTMISTGKESAALLKFVDGQVITMQANSSLKVRKYFFDPKKIGNSSIILSMLKGGMRFITGLAGQTRKQSFRLSTPNASIGIRGTDFMVAMSGNNMYSQVLAGKIQMTNATGMKVIEAGQFASVASSGALISVVSGSALPAGIFNNLISLPVTPSTIVPAASLPAVSPVPVPEARSSVIVAPVDVLQESTETAGKFIEKPIELESVEPIKALKKVPAKPEKMKLRDETDTPDLDTRNNSETGLIGKIGTLGYGAELNLTLTDSFNARFGINSFAYQYNANSNSINYDFKLQLQTVSVLADWYPFKGSFRTSGGLLGNNNKFTLSGKPTGGGYVIGNGSYPAADIDSLEATITFNTVAPYFGIGWGNPVAKNKGWGLVSDIGILFQGKPRVDLVAACAATATCTGLQANAEAENAKIQNDLSGFKYWPVASIGISYQW